MIASKSIQEPATPSDEAAVRTYRKAKAIADRFGVCPKTIFRLADAGKIARHKVNARLVLFDEHEVAEFIEKARVSS